MGKNFEILNGLPAYGEMYISIPENNYSEFAEGLAVKFIKNDKSQWIGNFEKGNSTLKYAGELKDEENILVIAYGICYIINPENTTPIIKFGYDYSKVFEYKNTFILIGEHSISVVENSYIIKHFENLCYDGINEVKLENDKIIGILNNYNSSENGYNKTKFILNLKTLEFKEIKKWWKIWK